MKLFANFKLVAMVAAFLTGHQALILHQQACAQITAANVSANNAPAASPTAASPTVIDEANLLAISFIDADRGWIAGERGVILHTQDGGMTWKPQATTSSARLADIAMYNSQRGLAIGGFVQPFSGISVGEVLVTKDGGQVWQTIEGHNLPRLRKMLTGIGGKCVAVGDWSSVHLTSIFVSSDGGASWQPQQSLGSEAIRDIAGDVDDYLVLGENGEVARYGASGEPQVIFPPNAKTKWQTIASYGNRRLLAGPTGSLVSDDRGKTWREFASVTSSNSPSNSSSALAIDETSIGSVQLWEDQVWLTSDTSDRIVSHDDLETRSVAHSSTSSIQSILRLDRDRGWAVGNFGLVMVTRDGGNSWRTIRGVNRAPAVMVVGSRPSSMPWSILATESLQHQRRVAIVNDVTAPLQSHHEIIADTCKSLGPSCVYDSNATKPRVTSILSIAKPAVVLLDSSLTDEQRSLWTSSALEAGCVRVLEINPRGSQTINVAAAIASAGILASDVWFDAIASLEPGYLPPSRLTLLPRYDMAGSSLASDGLASCVNHLPQYSWARDSVPSRRQLQVLQARSAEMNWIDSLVASASDTTVFRSQLTVVLPRMEEDDRTRLLSRLIALTAQRGRSDLYLATLEIIDQQLAPAGSESSIEASSFQRLANLRLASIRTSAEWRQTFGPIAVSGATAAKTQSPPSSGLPMPSGPAISPAPADHAVQWSPFQPSSNPATTIGLAGGHRASQTSAQMHSPNIQLASGLQRDAVPVSSSTAAVDLRWEFHPAVLLVNRAGEQLQNNLLALTEQNARTANSATTNLRRLDSLPSTDPWARLASDNRLPETIVCAVAPTPPHLDASFDESWWKDAQTFDIGNGSAFVKLAHDDDFLYVSIDSPALAAPRMTPQERRRDTPMDGSERYRFRLDIDRDLMTHYEFEFDSDGNTRDSCDGFVAFNPRWFIACKNLEGRTRAELAIQKSDLGAVRGAHDVVWNVSLDRLTHPVETPGLSMPIADKWLPAYLE